MLFIVIFSIFLCLPFVAAKNDQDNAYPEWSDEEWLNFILKIHEDLLRKMLELFTEAPSVKNSKDSKSAATKLIQTLEDKLYSANKVNLVGGQQASQQAEEARKPTAAANKDKYDVNEAMSLIDKKHRKMVKLFKARFSREKKIAGKD